MVRFSKSMKRDVLPGLTALVLLVVLVSGVISNPGAASAGDDGAMVMIPRSFAPLAQKASPAVVNISTEKTVNAGGGRVFQHYFRGPRGGGQDPFQDFFDQFLNNMPQRELKQRSLGSGFILDKEGYIVTNHHVIKDADAIRVKLKDGKEYDAKMIGTDASTDLALIKIEAKRDLPVLGLGDSDKLEVGQWVLAIGNPFGLEDTVTSGIVSAKGRVIGAGPYDDFIQTDASINPGNSGGPLLDMSGAVVGINTAIVPNGSGIGFAIPSNMAKTVIGQLKKNGSVTRGWLGIQIQNLDEELKQYYGVGKGVLVSSVFPGDPAEKAGIQENDIILSINGQPVDSSRELSQTVSGLAVGEKAEVKLLRNGKEKTIDVKIARRNDSKIMAENSETPGSGGTDLLGLQVSDLTPEISRNYGIEPTEGAVVVNVEPDGKGGKAGVEAGDLILEINHRSVKNGSDYDRIIKGIKKGEVVHLYIRRARQGFMVIKLTM